MFGTHCNTLSRGLRPLIRLNFVYAFGNRFIKYSLPPLKHRHRSVDASLKSRRGRFFFHTRRVSVIVVIIIIFQIMCYALVWLRRGLAQSSSPRRGFLLRLLIIIIRKRTHATIQYIFMPAVSIYTKINLCKHEKTAC